MGLKRKDHILIDYTSWFGAARQNRAAVRGPGAIEGPSAILPYGREKEERMNQKYRKENGVRGRRERKREREREKAGKMVERRVDHAQKECKRHLQVVQQ